VFDYVSMLVLHVVKIEVALFLLLKIVEGPLTRTGCPFSVV
jgi:hypothetical protein